MFFGGFGILGLLVAVAMYGVWRLSLHMRGEKWEPRGKPVDRLASFHEHQATMRANIPPQSWREKAWRIAFVSVGVAGGLAFGIFLITQSN